MAELTCILFDIVISIYMIIQDMCALINFFLYFHLLEYRCMVGVTIPPSATLVPSFVDLVLYEILKLIFFFFFGHGCVLFLSGFDIIFDQLEHRLSTKINQFVY